MSSDEDLRDSDVDVERDEMFPELAYEDSDGEFEPPTPEGLPSRSYTRRSQVCMRHVVIVTSIVASRHDVFGEKSHHDFVLE